MINFNFSRFDRSTTRAVNPANLIAVEGAPLVVDNSVDNGVKVSIGGAGEIFSGISISQQNTLTQSGFVDNLTASSSATPTTNLTYAVAATGTIYVYDNTTASALTVQTAASPASGFIQYTVGSTLLTLNSAQAGNSITVYYRYNLTASQSIGLQGTILPGGDSGAILNVVGVVIAGDVYTDQWDASVAWTTNPVVVALSTAGLFTVGGSGIKVPNSRVVHAPTSDDPFLGLSILNG